MIHGPDPLVMRHTAETLVRLACHVFQVEIEELCSGSRVSLLVHIRRIVAVAGRGLGCSYPAIGAALGRDHTTIMYAVRQAARLPADASFFEQCQSLVDAYKEHTNGHAPV